MMIRDIEGQAWEVTLSGPSYVGRQKDCDIVLAGAKVSRRHARFLPVGRSYVVEDLGSSNGVFINGGRVERRILNDGDVVEIGDFRIRYVGEMGEGLVGKVVGGYRVLRRIGTGGMGSVYLAEQSSMKRFVALKVLNEELTEDERFVKDFMNEAKLAGRLNHPNIVRVYDFGKLENTYFMAMEYVDGKTLRDRLDQEGKLPPLEVVHIMQSVSEALAHAHGHGIVHQDIKPQNIMIAQNNEVKLADLGLARFAGEGPDDKGRKVIVGTPHYISPEQGQRLPADARSDIYSLGATMFHLVTGRVPFDGANSLAIITKHIHQEPPSPKQFDVTLPDGLADLVLRCMQKKPQDRYANAGGLSAALTAVEKEVAASAVASARRREIGTAIRPRPVSTKRTRHEESKKSAAMVWMIVAASVVALFVAYAGIRAMAGGGGGGGDGGGVKKNDEARLLVERAEKALYEGADTSARRHAEEALAMVKEGEYADRARDVIRKVKSSRERSASRELALLKKLYEQDPQSAIPFLRSFIRENQGTQAAVDAGKMLSGAGGGEEGPSDIGPTEDGPVEVSGLNVDEAITKAAELEAAGEITRAIGVIRLALLKETTEEDAGKLEGALAPLLEKSHAEAEKAIKEAEGYLAEGRLGHASQVIRRGIRVASRDEDRRAIGLLRKRLEMETNRLLEGAAADLKVKLGKLDLNAARSEVDRLISTVGKENVPENIAAAGEVARLCGRGLDTIVDAVNSSPGRSAELTLSGGRPAWYTVKAATKEFVILGAKSGAEKKVEWSRMEARSLYQVLLAYGGKSKGGAGYAALLAALGDMEDAERLLDAGSEELSVMRKFASAAGRDKGEKIYAFRSVRDLLGVWEVKKGKWELGKDAMEVTEADEAVMALQRPVAATLGALKVEEAIVLGGGAGFAAMRLEAAEDVMAMIYVDDDGGRFEVRAGGSEKVFRIKDGAGTGKETLLSLDIGKGRIRGLFNGKEFPEVEVFGAEALSYNLTLEGMGRRFSVKRVTVVGK
ncbi:MAG: protein kinase [Planctomycetes bacterium]|nr:protein kinase [Planctomycetota bacterium]